MWHWQRGTTYLPYSCHDASIAVLHVLCPTTSHQVLHIESMFYACGIFGRSPSCFVQVYLNISGKLKLGCLAQAMVVAPKDTVATPTDGIDGMDEVEGEVDMEIEVRKDSYTTSMYEALTKLLGHSHSRSSNFPVPPALCGKHDA